MTTVNLSQFVDTKGNVNMRSLRAAAQETARQVKEHNRAERARQAEENRIARERQAEENRAAKGVNAYVAPTWEQVATHLADAFGSALPQAREIGETGVFTSHKTIALPLLAGRIATALSVESGKGLEAIQALISQNAKGTSPMVYVAKGKSGGVSLIAE